MAGGATSATTVTGTTVRVLTPMLPGAVGVVRLCGPGALSILDRAFEPVRRRDPATLQPNRLCFGRLVDAGEPLDDVVVAVTPDGASRWTVDINAHGGTRIVQRIVLLCERLGAVAAEASESANNTMIGEIDALLARAKTRQAALWLARQRTLLPAALHRIADGFAQADRETLARSVVTLEAMLAGYPTARRMIDGVRVALVGPVNAGKSTLTNRLAGRETSIATDRPGTTRDWVTGEVSLGGVPVELTDTAGLRLAGASLEHRAMERGQARAATADVVLWVIDGSRPLVETELWPAFTEPVNDRLITVLNQSDRGMRVEPDDLPAGLTERIVAVSALTGAGVDRLVDLILDRCGLCGEGLEGPVLLTPRQQAIASDLLARVRDAPAEAAEQVIEALIGGVARR
jgi:tRNA modification GTPase